MRRWIGQHLSWLGMAAFLGMWQLLGWKHLLPKYILPTPVEIGQAFVRDGNLLAYHSWVSLRVAFLGLLLGVCLALVLAIVMDAWPWLRDLFYPPMVLLQTIPTIALAPILVLWLGYGLLPKLVLIILTTVFPLLVSLLDGFRNMDPDMLNLFSLMRASKGQVFWHYKLPASLPYFFAGLRVSVSYAFVTTVVSEWLGGFEGLGVYMIQSKKLFQYDTMFAIIVLISAISLLGMKAVDVAERGMIKWRE